MTSHDADDHGLERGRSTRLIVLLVVGLSFCCCLGGAGFVAWGVSAFAGQAEAAIAANPVVQEHLGEVVETSIDLERTGAAPNDNVFVYHVRGTRGNGVVVGEFVTISADAEELRSGRLELPSGEVYDLVPE